MPVHPFIGFYFARKSLSELGYRFDANDLDVFEADAYLTISSKLASLENQEAKKNGSRR
jgi:hypothetical protein